MYAEDNGRTAQVGEAQLETGSGCTHAFYYTTAGHTLGEGLTWAAGTGGGCSGPLYELSLGVTLTDYFDSPGQTAGASAAFMFLGTAATGDFLQEDQGASYWVIFPHPNIRDINNIPAGCSFSEVGIQEFIFIDVSGVSSGVSTSLTTFDPSGPTFAPATG